MFQTPKFAQEMMPQQVCSDLELTVNHYLDSLFDQLAWLETQTSLKQSSQEQQMYHIRVISVHSSQSEEEEEHSNQNMRSNKRKQEVMIIREIDQNQKRGVTLQEQDAKINPCPCLVAKDQPQNCQLCISSKPTKTTETKQICFKRSRKVMASQVSKKMKEQESRYLDNSFSSKFNHKSMVLPFSKSSGSYNQLRDKMLVQYFYPKQKQIAEEFKEESQHKQYSLSKVFKKSKSEKKYDFFKNSKKKSFETVNQCGRRVKFTQYDLLSCRSSLSPFKNDKKTQERLNALSEREKKELRSSQVQLLKHRMIALESQVLQKMPYLLKMGVKFRRVHRH